MSTRTAFDRVFAIAPDGTGVLGWSLLAAGAHVVFGITMAGRAAAAPVIEPEPFEVELAPKPPEPEREDPKPPQPEEKAQAAAVVKAPVVTTPPPAARAGALLTAKPNATKPDDEPIGFLSDPDGGTYGHGVVAQGGTAEVGLKGATPTGSATAPVPTIDKPPAKVMPAADVPVTNLSRMPSLPAADACKGFFPSSADDDVAVVTVRVVVRPNGDVASVVVTKEDPRGQGFGQAARACLLKSRFVSGLDVEGRPVTAQALVNVRFFR